MRIVSSCLSTTASAASASTALLFFLLSWTLSSSSSIALAFTTTSTTPWRRRTSGGGSRPCSSTSAVPSFLSSSSSFSSNSRRLLRRGRRRTTDLFSSSSCPLRLSASAAGGDDDFSSFASSLEEEKERLQVSSTSGSGSSKTRSSSSSTSVSATASSGGAGGGTQKKKTRSSIGSTGRSSSSSSSWKEDLDELVDFTTPASRRQTLLQKLLKSNQEIRGAVEKALKDRNIDPLLTPTQRKLQDGTRAVARQVTSDILPQLAQTVAGTTVGDSSSSSRPTSPFSAAASLLARPPPGAEFLFTRAGPQILSLAQRGISTALEELQQDLADPVARIPQRLSQQFKEAQNVFSETPKDLKEPKYKVVFTADDYEIRDYETYKVASTQMKMTSTSGSSSSSGSSDAENDNDRDGESIPTTSSTTDWTQQGAAFNTLASYLFGDNAESRAMDMTTPVTTTMTGEMRFYLDDGGDVPPAPLTSQSSSEKKKKTTTSSSDYAIEIQTLPPSRLAVRRFTGFVTDGEIARQKQALLTALELDQVELDVKHGQTVPHVIFQYNPPYTLPVIRRNEIAVPVVGTIADSEDLEGGDNLITPPTWWANQDPWEIPQTNNEDVEE